MHTRHCMNTSYLLYGLVPERWVLSGVNRVAGGGVRRGMVYTWVHTARAYVQYEPMYKPCYGGPSPVAWLALLEVHHPGADYFWSQEAS